MTKEQLFFIQILSDHLNGRETKCNDVLDWDIIHEYALKHQVSGIVYMQAKNFMPVDIQNTFRQETMATLYQSTIRDNDFAAVTNVLSEKNIPYFIVKGPAVATLFPNPKLRSMGDIDLVVKHEDREKCHNIIVNNGYECASKQDDREWQYYKNNMELELHDRLVYEEAVNEKGQDKFFNDCWRYVREGQLDWNFHLLFLIFHLRKHFMNSGVGFRMFMDLAVVAEKTHIDWAMLQEKLENTGMLEFAKKCFGFIEQWFGIQVPLADNIDDIFYEEATQKIFADGLFGFDNSDNIGSGVINQIRKQRFGKITTVRIIAKEVFPSHKKLKYEKQYTYLNKYPVLLPIAWIQRACRGIKQSKMKTALCQMRRTFVSREQLEKRNDMMRKWGI